MYDVSACLISAPSFSRLRAPVRPVLSRVEAFHEGLSLAGMVFYLPTAGLNTCRVVWRSKTLENRWGAWISPAVQVSPLLQAMAGIDKVVSTNGV